MIPTPQTWLCCVYQQQQAQFPWQDKNGDMGSIPPLVNKQLALRLKRASQGAQTSPSF